MTWPQPHGSPTRGELDVDHVLERWEQIEENGCLVPAENNNESEGFEE